MIRECEASWQELTPRARSIGTARHETSWSLDRTVGLLPKTSCFRGLLNGASVARGEPLSRHHALLAERDREHSMSRSEKNVRRGINAAATVHRDSRAPKDCPLSLTGEVRFTGLLPFHPSASATTSSSLLTTTAASSRQRSTHTTVCGICEIPAGSW